MESNKSLSEKLETERKTISELIADQDKRMEDLETAVAQEATSRKEELKAELDPM